MKEVLGKYKPYVPMMLLVVMFLFGQAMSELMLPSYMSDIINNGVVKGDIPYIYSLGLRMVLVSFLAVACAITGNLIAARVAAGSARDIRSSLFRRVMTYSAKEYSLAGHDVDARPRTHSHPSSDDHAVLCGAA